MNEKKELIGVKIFDRGEKFTKQVKITLPKNYIQEINQIVNEMQVPKRLVVWDAVGHYIRICRKPEV